MEAYARQLVQASMALCKSAARRVMYEAVRPIGPLRPLYEAAFHAQAAAVDLQDWAWRSLVATPMFLARCASYGERVTVDRVPYVVGQCRFELGNDVRISGKINVLSAWQGEPVLRVGDGVYIGHGSSFSVGQLISIGNYVGIGPETHIADTNGHTHRALNQPIWEDRPGPADVASVHIEDNVHIGRRCMILKGVRIGARSIIGAGAVVRRSVPPDSIVVGDPARVNSWRRMWKDPTEVSRLVETR